MGSALLKASFRPLLSRPPWVSPHACFYASGVERDALAGGVVRYEAAFNPPRVPAYEAGGDRIASPAAPLFAAGIRPSDGSPEPVPGWEVAGCDQAGFAAIEWQGIPSAPSTRALLDLSDGGTANRIHLLLIATGQVQAFCAGGGSAASVTAGSGIDDAGRHKAVVAWGDGKVGVCVDGGSVVEVVTPWLSPAAFNQCRLHNRINGAAVSGGLSRRIQIGGGIVPSSHIRALAAL